MKVVQPPPKHTYSVLFVLTLSTWSLIITHRFKYEQELVNKVLKLYAQKVGVLNELLW